MRQVLAMGAALALTAALGQASAKPPAPHGPPPGAMPATPAPSPRIPAGAYTLDKAHTSLLFRVSHMGFSNYTARFNGVDAKLWFDPAHPGASRVEVQVDPRSLDVENPPPGFLDELRGPQFLDAAKYPAITFRSTSVTQTGPKTARIAGQFTLHGVTRPLALDATFNGGYGGMPGMDPQARVGFSAKGTLKRSDYGIGFGVPAPGSTFGVGDQVQVIIEAEFNGPSLPGGPGDHDRHDGPGDHR